MKNIIDLAKTYASSYQDCFYSESTDSWIVRFAAARYDNTLTEIEITEEERQNKQLKSLFCNEFLKHTKEIISQKQITTDEKGNKKKLVKRKKD